MYKPWHSLAFGILFFFILGLTSYFFPPNGISLRHSFTLKFPGLQELFFTAPQKKDISRIIAAADKEDVVLPNVPVPAKDSIFSPALKESATTKIPPVTVQKKVSVPNSGIQSRNHLALKKFFDALIALKNNETSSMHVLHYGDSQIEGDRITDYLRLKLQSQFGGQGPGLLSLMPISSSVINKVTNSAGWDRYNAFSGKDKRVNHNNFGVLAGFNRYCEYKKVSDTSRTISASVNITTTQHGGPTAMSYKKFRLFYGGAKKRTWCEFYDGPALMAADSLMAGGYFAVKEFDVGRGSYTHTLKFRGKDSPDFYAISLESESGIMVDNIALRGSSGTFFHLMNQAQIKQFYEFLNVKLIILQFGGNALPSIESEQMAKNYAGYLRSQISIIKKVAPQASILFIGPSDMSIKSGMDYVTYPLLETLRDEIKKVVIESGCAFYDMYDSMGGYNSMPSWVEQRLAASDYTHFSPKGARKIANLFYTALINEYSNYVNSIP